MNPESSILFQPFSVKGEFVVKNRIVMAPVYISSNFYDKSIQSFYLRRAQGGAGMIIMPISTIDGLDELKKPEFMKSSRNLIAEFHAHQCKIIPQLFSGAGERVNDYSQAELSIIPTQFAVAVSQIQDAGYDGVEIHGAHHSLFMHLLSPILNQRSDAYGNTFENRSRLQLTTIQAIRAVVDRDFPIFFRFSASDLAPGGVDLSSTIPYAKKLVEAGVDCLDISAGGTGASPKYSDCPDENQTEACFAPFFSQIKEAVKIPIIGAGKIISGKTAETLIMKGKTDLIGLGRMLIADPDWPNKIETGRETELLAFENWIKKIPTA